MSDAAFGDWEPDDSFDTAEADPEQVAIKLEKLRNEFHLGNGDGWDDLNEGQRQRRVEMVVRFLEWWRRQGLR
jgi:hypothetical protein